MLKIENADWRTKIRIYLNEHCNEVIPISSIWEMFGKDMPLHHATRIWSNRYPKVSLPEPMRWMAFKHNLAGFTLEILPTRKPITMNHFILPLTRNCVYCNNSFVGSKGSRYCSRTCAGHGRKSNERLVLF